MARLLIRVHGQPVGYADLVADMLPTLDHAGLIGALDPETIERASNHLIYDLTMAGIVVTDQPADLNSLLDQAQHAQVACRRASDISGPLVSVAICTRDRAETISATLESLERQTYRNIEVLVIDNAPTNNATEQLVHADFPFARYIREPRRGLNHARNCAVAEARGPIVAFIDDDATAEPVWVEALVAAFDTPAIMCVTGLVAPARLDTPGQELFERFGYSKGFSHLIFSLATPPPDMPIFPYKGYLGTGCNCAFRREVFGRVGLFDPRLDMGTPVPGGGDHDMFARIIRAGHALAYDPNPVVFHHHLEDLDVVINRLGEYQESFMAFMTKSILTDRTYALPLLRHMLFWYVRRTVRGLAAAVVKKHERPFRMVLSEAIGAWRGPLSLYRSHRNVLAESRTFVEDIPPPLVAPVEPVRSSDRSF
ncbi:MAG TPA: glycosyltransferase [Roseiflexaceae bacterium]|nr:glycosyltransferase [Roseiflexaceae bacterium]